MRHTQAHRGEGKDGEPVRDVTAQQERIAELAKWYPDRGLTTLNAYLDEGWLKEAFRRTRKDGATGVDGISARAYEEGLDERLRDLLKRAKSGSYQAPPVRRTYIPKPGSIEKRALGIPTTEDKVLQRAVAMLLEPIYEQEFSECSYGFRPGRSAHQALQALREAVMETRGGWIVEVDIRKFFDTLDHDKLLDILSQRVRDGVLTRLVKKWLKAGVLEAGQWKSSEEGTPQGGVISPLLSNIFLHEVMDRWFAEQIQPRLKGRSTLVRYADDLVMTFERKDDAERVMQVLPKRFGRYGLSLHPEKTRLVSFQRPSFQKERDRERSQSFDFLGFTHYWAQSRNGNWVVKRKTAKSRFKRGVQAIKEWCRNHRHLPLREQQETLNQKLAGHYSYYGITGNNRSLQNFWRAAGECWRKWLSRRDRQRCQTRKRFYDGIARAYPLLPPRIVHSIYLACETAV